MTEEEQQKKLLKEIQDLKQMDAMLMKSTMDMAIEAREANVKLNQKDVELDRAYTAMKAGAIALSAMGATALFLGYIVIGPAVSKIINK